MRNGPYRYDSRILTSTDRKKADKSTGQDIPFNIQFTEKQPTMLSVGYTPAGASAKYGTIWTDSTTFDTNKTHNIALAWDTTAGNNANKLQMWYVTSVPVFQVHDQLLLFLSLQNISKDMLK